MAYPPGLEDSLRQAIEEALLSEPGGTTASEAFVENDTFGNQMIDLWTGPSA
jgi:hypothetical protein